MVFQDKNITANGFINFYKGPGITSMEAVRRIKKIPGMPRKIGHAGTLDPLAKGLLPICVGKGTRLMENVLGGRKRYQVDITLGAVTETYDAEGTITITGSVDGLSQPEIERCMQTFIGESQQIPPMYSALKVEGKRLYELARAGKSVPRQPRPITIYDIHILDFYKSSLRLMVECGKGVYIRSLAHDLGQKLGCGGYVTDLERTACGSFYKSEAVTLQDLEAKGSYGEIGWVNCLEPIDFVLQGLNALVVSDSAKPQLVDGMSVELNYVPESSEASELFRAYDKLGRFLALVHYDTSNGLWKPVKVFNENQISKYASVSNSI